ncbi:hypothetical protein PGTUg99_029092 [Puccinia graminis f. sp. tritici]|uniref:Uncharacterized protein n=1 Tax=Puccinia graminis f. sp. tritici TaxID=56615 RepID=A0A5B0MAX9_PUCGR|nr:hypothetical protein PGTUg99_029092 [Puccinia graminis f. sp. tritici]
MSALLETPEELSLRPSLNAANPMDSTTNDMEMVDDFLADEALSESNNKESERDEMDCSVTVSKLEATLKPPPKLGEMPKLKITLRKGNLKTAFPQDGGRKSKRMAAMGKK